MSDNDENIAHLRKRAEAADEAEREAATLRRQLALRDAGFDGNDKLIQHLLNGYTGEPTKEAVTAFLTDLGVSTPTTTPAVPEIVTAPTVDSTIDEHRRALAADSQAPTTDPRPRTDPWEAAFLNKQAGLRRGEDADDLIEQGLAAVMGAAALGDKRVLVKQGPTEGKPGYSDPRQPRL